MAVQPHGISRSRFHPRAARLERRPEPNALLADVGVLADGHDELIRHVDQFVDRITRRVNEMILSGTLAERPAAGVADRIYLVVTNHVPGPMYFDDGGQWILVGSPTLETQRATLTDGAVSHTFTVAQASALYMPSFSTTWWTMLKVTTQTGTALTVQFSNPATAGDVLTVVIP